MSKQAHIMEVIQSVADEFGVDPVTIITHPRGDRNLTAARAVCAWMLQGTMSNPKIGKLLGRSSRSYVAGAVGRVKTMCKADHNLQRAVMKLAYRLN